MIKVFLSLDPNLKIKYIFLLFLIMISILIELLSFSSLIPLFNFLLTPYEEVTSRYFLLNNLINKLQIDNHYELIIYTLSFIIILFIFKFIFFVFFYFYESKFLYQLQYKLSQATYKRILFFNYNKFKSLHSSEILRNITAEVNACISIFNSITTLIVEISVSIFLIILVLYVNKVIIIPSLLFICFISIFYLFIFKKKLTLWGVQRQEIESLRIKKIYEGIKGFKEIKSYNLENYFLNIFRNTNYKYSDINRKQYLISQFPRIFLEMVLILFVFLLMIILLKNIKDINQILITLGIVSAFSFRLLPSANKIITNIQNLKFYKPSLLVVLNLFNSPPIQPKLKSNIELLNIDQIQLNNISFKYKDNKNIIKNLNLRIYKDQHIGFYGESGVGKTTFIDILLGLLKPDTGEIIINDDKKIYHTKYYNNIISYVPQENFLINDTILNNIVFGFHLNNDDIDHSLIKNIIDKVNLKKIIDKLDYGLNTIVDEDGSNFSVGQVQRIIMARALYRQPKLLILDEPTSALDIENENNIIEILKNLKKTGVIVIAISHSPNFFRNFDKLYKIENNIFIEENIT